MQRPRLPSRPHRYPDRDEHGHTASHRNSDRDAFAYCHGLANSCADRYRAARRHAT